MPYAGKCRNPLHARWTSACKEDDPGKVKLTKLKRLHNYEIEKLKVNGFSTVEKVKSQGGKICERCCDFLFKWMDNVKSFQKDHTYSIISKSASSSSSSSTATISQSTSSGAAGISHADTGVDQTNKHVNGSAAILDDTSSTRTTCKSNDDTHAEEGTPPTRPTETSKTESVFGKDHSSLVKKVVELINDGDISKVGVCVYLCVMCIDNPSSYFPLGSLSLGSLCTHVHDRVKCQDTGCFSSMFVKFDEKNPSFFQMVYSKYKKGYFAISEFSLEKRNNYENVLSVFLKCKQLFFFLKMYLKH